MSQRNRQRKHKHLTGEHLAYYRKVAGMTQHDVARGTDISCHRLSYAGTDRLELRQREMDVPTAPYKKHTRQAIAATEFPWNGQRAGATRSPGVRDSTAIGAQTDGLSAGGESESSCGHQGPEGIGDQS